MRKEVLILSAIFLSLVPLAQGAVIRGQLEDIFLVRPESRYLDASYIPPEYLSLEDLVFYTCVEEPNITIKSSVICLDDNSFDDVRVYQWSEDNCYIGSYDLDDKECEDIIIQSDYVKNDEPVTLQKEIKVNRFSSLIERIEEDQYSDGGWKQPIDTAYGIWALSYFPDIYARELDLAMDWLKEYRDNDDKCWPAEVGDSSCDIRDTANILMLLTEAGYNNSFRVVRDGHMYLERLQNFYTDETELTANITPYLLDSDCLISYGDENTTVNLSSNEYYGYEFVPVYGKDLDIACTNDMRINVSTHFDEGVFYYEGDNMSYSLPGPCWSTGTKWGQCDIRTTLFATLTNISWSFKQQALEWLPNTLNFDGNKGKYVGDDQNKTHAALYLYAVNDSGDMSSDSDINYSYSDVKEWLLFKQNNDGSWGEGNVSDRVLDTAFSVFSFAKNGMNRTDEVIEDAERWISRNELAEGWNNTVKDGAAFYILRNNARPFLKSDPLLIIMDSSSLEIELYNPTTFDLNQLSYNFSDNLKDILEIEAEDELSGYSYIQPDIYKVKEDTGTLFGFLHINNYENEISRIPVLIVQFPHINITASQESISVFGTKGQLKFSVDKSIDTFDCTLAWDDPDISSKTEFDLVSESSIDLEVKFREAERLEKSYTGEFVCSTRERTFLSPFSVDIERYPSIPFSVEPKVITVNESRVDRSIIITNLLDETIDVDLALAKSAGYFDLERKNLVLNPAEERNFTIFNLAPLEGNISLRTSIDLSSLGQKDSVTFIVDIPAVEKKTMNPIFFFGLLFLMLAAIGAAGFLAYKNQDKIKKLFNKKTMVEDVKNRIRMMEEQGTETAIVNMTKLLRFQGKKDEEIKRKLKQEGFKPEEIEKSFKKL